MANNSLVKNRERFPALFNDFFQPWSEWFSDRNTPALTMPAVNIAEEEGRYAVTLAAPGMKKSDFKIDLDGNLMTISAEHETENEEKKKRYSRKEYNYTSFSRSFTLPEEVDSEHITAGYDNGVLSVLLPRKEQAKPRKAKSIKIS